MQMADGFPGAIPVRDGKNPRGPAVVLPTAAWAAFVGAVTIR
ncbi:DUF397 domain-containing protein [Streptomyces sp. NPDC007346]